MSMLQLSVIQAFLTKLAYFRTILLTPDLLWAEVAFFSYEEPS